MISLAITASLLTAVAAAFSAAASATEANDRYFRATQAGRVALHQLLSEIRRADAVDVSTVSTTGDTLTVWVTPDRLQQNESHRTFFFYPASGTETPSLRFNWTTTPATGSVVTPNAKGWRMCSNVIGNFRADTRLDTLSNGSQVNTVIRVAVAVVVTVEGQRIEFSGSAAPRRAMLY